MKRKENEISTDTQSLDNPTTHLIKKPALSLTHPSELSEYHTPIYYQRTYNNNYYNPRNSLVQEHKNTKDYDKRISLLEDEIEKNNSEIKNYIDRIAHLKKNYDKDLDANKETDSLNRIIRMLDAANKMYQTELEGIYHLINKTVPLETKLEILQSLDTTNEEIPITEDNKLFSEFITILNKKTTRERKSILDKRINSIIGLIQKNKDNQKSEENSVAEKYFKASDKINREGYRKKGGQSKGKRRTKSQRRAKGNGTHLSRGTRRAKN